MTKIISTHSFRGGTGKSNITANVAALLARRGNRVGVIDTDIQSPGIHVIFNLDDEQMTYTLNDYLWNNCSIEDATYMVTNENGGAVYLVPSSIKANDIARVLREKYDANDMHEAFRSLISSYKLDYLFIDTHPGLNEETLLSIAISDKLIIVLRPDRQDFQGTSVTVDVARRLRVPEIHLVVNKVPSQFNFGEVKQQVEDTYRCQVAALLELSADLAENASSTLFCLENPDHPFTLGVNNLVELCELDEPVGSTVPDTVAGD